MRTAFRHATERADVINNPNKGTLWPYTGNIDLYGCPRHRERWWRNSEWITVATYAIVASANGGNVEGTHQDSRNWRTWVVPPGKRVGKTVLKLTRITDIGNPPASQRAVFVDVGHTARDFVVPYLYPEYRSDHPPTSHAQGATFSMADGHAEYWKWRGRETVDWLDRPDWDGVAPKTEEGMYDLQRLQKAIWGRLGYSSDESP